MIATSGLVAALEGGFLHRPRGVPSDQAMTAAKDSVLGAALPVSQPTIAPSGATMGLSPQQQCALAPGHTVVVHGSDRNLSVDEIGAIRFPDTHPSARVPA